VPTWYAETIHFLWSYSAWFALTVILGGIIIQFLIRPYFAKVSGGFHKIVCYVEKLHDSKIDPSKIDKRGYPVLIATHDIVSALKESRELLIKHCDAAFCPVVPIIMKDWKETREAMERANATLLIIHNEFKAHLGQIAESTRDHLDRAVKVKAEVEANIQTVLERDEQQHKEFLVKLLEISRETERHIDAGYERMNNVLNTILADKNAQMAENNVLMSRVVTALEKLAIDRAERLKNGGK
jgi:hypothetical protein